MSTAEKPNTGKRGEPGARIFLSWASHDAKLAIQLWERLRVSLKVSELPGQPLDTWSCHSNQLLGLKWELQIRHALDISNVGVFAISRAFLLSNYIQTVELSHFFGSVSAPVVYVGLGPLPARANLRGLDAADIIAYHRPYQCCSTEVERIEFADRLADEILTAVDYPHPAGGL